MLRRFAYAKINLSLEVLRKRPDGYHDVATVLQAISLHDTLTFARADTLSLTGTPPGVAQEQDLVFQAARLLQQATGTAHGARIVVTKRIPVAGGLGGGSSDAACALQSLNELWGLGLPAERLHKLAAQLGSDVPFFLGAPTALAMGRGDRLTPVPSPRREQWLVLLSPPQELPRKTARLYGALTPAHWTDGSRTHRLAELLGSKAQLSDADLFNVFEAVAYALFSGLTAYRDALLNAGAPAVHLSGSGPTLFALAPDEHEARRMQRRLSREGHRSLVARTTSLDYT